MKYTELDWTEMQIDSDNQDRNYAEEKYLEEYQKIMNAEYGPVNPYADAMTITVHCGVEGMKNFEAVFKDLMRST